MSSTPTVNTETSLAVVGLAGRFASAASADEFWEVLSGGQDLVRPISGRWDTEAELDPELRIQSVGGFLEDVSTFDAAFFGISPREAAAIDPQQRLILETVWRTLEDAGVPARSLRGTRTGMYVGASWHDYEILRKQHGARATQHSAVGNALDVIASRPSYFLGLRGPSLVVETGCSSSLVALDLARQAVISGEVDGAFVAGVNLILTPDVSIGLTHFGGLSPTGRSRAFSDNADGFVRAECVASLYVKRLDRALADGDRIRAVVITSAVNNDGGGESLVTPALAGQEDLLSRVYDADGVDVDQLAYIEAHGTGTRRGDPVEIDAIGRVVGARRSDHLDPVGIGSAKTNIGHAEASAGLVGLVKSVLSLEHGLVPASLHAHNLNPDIDFDTARVRVVHEPMPLGPGALVGLNSFGWGGTNAHVVLRSADGLRRDQDVARARPARDGGVQVVPVSAISDSAASASAGQVASTLRAGADLDGVVTTLTRHRDHFGYRVAACATSPAEAAELLEAYATDPALEHDDLVAGRASDLGRIAMVFPGQGGQWAGMAAALYGTDPAFTDVLDRCSLALEPYLDLQLTELLTGSADSGWLDRVDLVQPALWAVSVALAATWEAVGVRPDVVLGHSQGEVSAATVAGILTVEDGARVVAMRSRLAVRASGKGRMLAIGLGAEEALRAAAGFEGLVDVAVSNSPTSSVLSGDEDVILALAELLDLDGVFCKVVDVDYASHSPHMDPLLPELVESLASIRPQPGRIRLVSTVRVEEPDGHELDGAYWAENLRSPVRFREAMEAAFDDGVTHVIEVSPHPLLLNALGELMVARGLASNAGLGTLRRDEGTPRHLARAFAAAFVAGITPCTSAAPAARDVPGYPFQRERFWVPQRQVSGTTSSAITLVPSPGDTGVSTATTTVDGVGLPWILDHRVGEAVVVPAAAMVSWAMRAGRERTGRLPTSLRAVRFLRDLTIPEAGATLAHEWRDDIADGGRWILRSLDADHRAWSTNAECWVRYGVDTAAPAGATCPGPGTEAIDVAEFYRTCATRGLSYGPSFQGLTGLWRDGDDGAVGRVVLPSQCQASAAAQDPHPALLDAALQTCLALEPGSDPVVPTSVEQIEARPRTPADGPLLSAWVRCTRRPTLDDDVVYDLDLYGEDRCWVMGLRGVTLQRLTASTPTGTASPELHLAWLEVPRGADAASTTSGDWIVTGEGADDVAAQLGIEVWRDDEPIAGRGVIVLTPTASAGLPAQLEAITATTGLIRTSSEEGVTSPLVVVTTHGQAPPGDRLVDPGAAQFWGIARVLRREHPETATRVVDVERTGDWVRPLAAEIMGGTDDQVVLRGERRWVGRLAVGADDPTRVPAPTTAADRPFALVPAETGVWDGLEFTGVRLREPGPRDVVVAVTATALNFIDVMKSMGTYPDPVGGGLLGGECAGSVVSVGSDVDDLAPGDRVVACEFGALASHVVADAGRVRRIPGGLDDPTAAALPLVYVTAWYGLVDLGRVDASSTVLVHSAAGGLGLAAVAVAQMHGATVIATAGTEEKRSYLRQRGVAHVFDSRDVQWADQVRAVTGGHGVDIVLNSLTGAAIDLGLDVLAEDGVFVEVGKRDIYDGRRVSLSSFRKGIALAAVDIAGLMDRRPGTFSAVLDRVWHHVEDGRLPSLPVTTSPFVTAPDTLRAMAAGRHVGKLVVTDPATVPEVAVRALEDGRFSSDGVVVVSGGLGALGLSVTEHLAEHGVRALALLGRRAAGREAEERLAHLRRSGVDVRTHEVDVADADRLSEVLAQIRSSQGAIRGVVHAAGVLDDATAMTMTAEQVRAVAGPKALGALNLDRLTAPDGLDFFVTFSSAAGLVGNPGQAAYAAANAFVDGLVESRRLGRRPGLSIQWGPFEDVGLAAAEANRGGRLADRGMRGFTTSVAWPAMMRLLAGGHVVSGYVPIDARQWFDAYPDTATIPAWMHVRELLEDGSEHRGGGQFLERFLACPDDDRDDLVQSEVATIAARVLRLDPDAVDPTTPFKGLGMDSLMSLEYRNMLEAVVGLALPPTLLWTHGTASALGRALAERLRESALEQA